MIKTVQMYKVICDGCETDAERDSDFFAWTRPDDAWEMASNGDWHEINGKHYCTDCYELNEETDEYVVKEK